MSSIRIAIASTTSKPGALADNLKQIREFARRAQDDGVDLLLTPEMSASGYGAYPEVLATAEPAGRGPIYDFLARAAHISGVVISAGFVEINNQHKYLAQYAVYPNGHFIAQRKHRIMPNEQPLAPAVPFVRSEDEPRREGCEPSEPKFEVFQVRDVRCAIVICADFGICGLHEYLASQHVQLVLGPVGGGGKRGDRVTTQELCTEAGLKKYQAVLETVFFPGAAITKCIKYRHAQAAVNLCGYDGKQYYHVGHGMIINAMGEVIGFFHGLPNLDRQRPLYASATVETHDCLSA